MKNLDFSFELEGPEQLFFVYSEAKWAHVTFVVRSDVIHWEFKNPQAKDDYMRRLGTKEPSREWGLLQPKEFFFCQCHDDSGPLSEFMICKPKTALMFETNKAQELETALMDKIREVWGE